MFLKAKAYFLSYQGAFVDLHLNLRSGKLSAIIEISSWGTCIEQMELLDCKEKFEFSFKKNISYNLKILYRPFILIVSGWCLLKSTYLQLCLK